MIGTSRILLVFLVGALSVVASAQRVGEPGKRERSSISGPRYLLSGLVVDPLQEPISKAVVEIVADQVVGAKPHVGRSYSEGSFVMGGLPLSTFALRARITVSAPGYVTQTRFAYPEHAIDGNLHVGTFQMEVGTTVRGTVVDPQGEPISGARLRLGPGGAFEDRSIGDQWTTESDFDGRFAVSKVPYGEQWLGVLAAGHLGRVEKVEVTEGLDLRVVLKPSERRIPVRIEGERQPWRFAPEPLRVHLWSASKKAWLPSSAPLQVDEEGGAWIPDVETEDWSAWLVGGEVAHSIRAGGGGRRRIEELRFPWPDRTERTLRWSITGPESERPPGFWLSGEDGSVRYLKTGESGMLQTPVRRSIRYRLLAETEGVRSHFSVPEREIPPAAALGFDGRWASGAKLLMESSSSVRVRVVDPEGRPVYQCVFTAWRHLDRLGEKASRSFLGRFVSDEEGRVEVPGILAGSYLSLACDDRDHVGQIFEVVDPAQAVFPFVVQKASVVEGIVKNEEGEPVAGARVRLDTVFPQRPSLTTAQRTDRDGRFRFLGVTPGRQSLSVGEPAMRFREFQVDPGQTRAIELQY